MVGNVPLHNIAVIAIVISLKLNYSLRIITLGNSNLKITLYLVKKVMIYSYIILFLKKFQIFMLFLINL